MTARPTSPDEGRPPGPAVVPDDITSVVDDWPIGYVQTNSVGVIEVINSTLQSWLGVAAEDVVGRRSFQELLSGGSRIYFDTHVRPLLHMQQGVREIALDLVRSDRSRLPGLINATVERDPRTGSERVVIIVIDATSRRSYERERLRERQAAERSEARLKFMYDIVADLAEAVTVDDIVQVVTDRGRRSIDGASCTVWFVDAAVRNAVRVDRADRSVEESTALAFPEGGPALDQLAAGRLVVVADREAEQSTYPLICAWMRQVDRRSAVMAPLIIEARLHGVISYMFDDPHDFDENELNGVWSLAAQTEGALRRGLLLDAERRSRARLESLAQLTTLLSGSLTVGDIIDVIADDGVKLLGAASVRVVLLDEAKNTVTFARGSGIGGHVDSAIPLTSRDRLRGDPHG